jgi:hypothetical protein
MDDIIQGSHGVPCMICVTPLEHCIERLQCVVSSGHPRQASMNLPLVEGGSRVPLLLKVVCKGTVLVTPLSISHAVQVIIF